jgi:hypothetical protein
MGLFKDFATSGYGDFTMGALSGIAERGARDAERNSVFAQDSLNKENAAFKETELAFNNKKQITNIIANNPLAFGITATADLNANQIADRLTNRIYNEQRSIFENKDFNKVKMGVAQYLTRPDTLGSGIELTSPYIPSEDLFNAEQEKHSAKLSEISKMPRVDKLLMKIKQADENVVTPEAITNSLTKVASITAKGYGILNTFPGTELGDTNLKFMQTNIIVANARAQFPNDATARSNFIDKKLYDNNIDPMSAVNFQNPVTFKAMSKVLETQGNALASKISELTNAMAQAPDDEGRVQIQNQINQVIMQQYQLINTFSQAAPMALAGKDKDLKQPITPPVEEAPAVEDEQAPGLFKRKTKPGKPLKEILPDFRGGEPEDTGLDDMQASAVTKTPERVKLASKDMDFQSALKKSESSDNYMVVNKEGYMGAYQFGDARLKDYKRETKEDFTNEEFLNNEDLQEKVYSWHVNDIVKYIQKNKLDDAIGKKVNGVTITLNGLIAAAHLGGRFGMRQYVESGFDDKFNKEDSNGTSLFDYITRFQLTK